VQPGSLPADRHRRWSLKSHPGTACLPQMHLAIHKIVVALNLIWGCEAPCARAGRRTRRARGGRANRAAPVRALAASCPVVVFRCAGSMSPLLLSALSAHGPHVTPLLLPKDVQRARSPCYAVRNPVGHRTAASARTKPLDQAVNWLIANSAQVRSDEWRDEYTPQVERGSGRASVRQCSRRPPTAPRKELLARGSGGAA
jgi:hypothetical protein